MKIHSRLNTFAISVYLICACSHISPNLQDKYLSNEDELARDYQNGVIDSIIPDKSKIYPELVEINGPESSTDQEWITVNGRNMILVTTLVKDEYIRYWMKKEPFEVKVDCWVSVPSEWSRFKQEFEPLDDKADKVRMQQLLGMPLNDSYNVLIEFYADAEKIFRPSKDSEAYDSVASLNYPEGTSEDYKQWFENHKKKSYECSPAFPFTQLGYSYDWNRYSAKHIGLSEFVVPKGTLVKVKSRKNYQDFIKEIR